jgi:hypothetical protein
MQYLLFVIISTASGNIDYKEPVALYSKKACTEAQDMIVQMTPRNATVTITTACVKRGNDR